MMRVYANLAKEVLAAVAEVLESDASQAFI